MEGVDEASLTAAAPELTELGKRIEILRIDRGISKQHLARFADTSRQQLWRVMTGKSELTFALRSRIAEALKVQPSELDGLAPSTRSMSVLPTPIARDLPDYLGNTAAIAMTLSTLPNGEAGRALKRGLLDALEDLAITEGHTLTSEFFELRRQVLMGQL
jgi:transcriptional regulator with XRE-family HTH domain